MPSIDELCDAVLAARDAKDAAKAAFDRADQAFGAAERALVEAMLDIGQDAAEHGGTKFATKTKISWKAPTAQQATVIQLLRGEAPEVIKESVHPATLNKFMNEQEKSFSDGGPAWWSQLREVVERKEATVLSLTKSKKKK